MRSVYAKVLWLSLAILTFSLGVFLFISRLIAVENFGANAPVGKNATLQYEEASRTYNEGGAAALATYLDLLHSAYPRCQFVFVRNGRDVVSGTDYSRRLRAVRSIWSPINVAGPILVAIPSAQSEYALTINMRPPSVALYLPYYLVLLCSVGILAWALAWQFARPLLHLSETLQRFGAGDLSARVRSQRRDEIGAVTRAFDHMADRIETLLITERRLLRDISHELRSPLARLSFAAQLACTSHDGNAAKRVTKEVARLTALVESLLQAARSESDLLTCSLENVAFDALVRELVADCEIEAGVRPCSIRLTGSGFLELPGNAELLRRAVENIFRNAIRYAPAGSSIEVRLAQSEAKATLSVRDYGCGVPSHALATIFEPFYRVDSSRDSATGGIGLGLAIAKRAVEVHHGQIWAENADPGLRVVVELPLSFPPSAVAQRSNAVQASSQEFDRQRAQLPN